MRVSIKKRAEPLGKSRGKMLDRYQDLEAFKELIMFKELKKGEKIGELEELEEQIEFALNKIRMGYDREKITESLKGGILSPEEIYEVARNRIRAKEKFGSLNSRLFFDDTGLRYSTPAIVAEYRAKRLKCDSIADISCGVGAQLIFFARECEKAIGVEIDRRRAKLAWLNTLSMNLDNVEIFAADALSYEVIKKIDAEVIFSDPSRPPEEKIRTFRGLEPPPEKVLERYSDVTTKFAFELPPQMPPERIPIKGEKEYTSLNFRLNRLALYCNELAECEVSAITLPSGERVTSEDEKTRIEGGDVGSFLHEVDFTIIKAKLLPNLVGKLDVDVKLIFDDGRRVILSSESEIKSSFIRNYSVESICNFSIPEINQELKRIGAGKVTLRFSIEPENYWNVRKRIENGLQGEEWFYLFRIGNKAVITRA